jgi:hypothetical protein
MAFQDWGNPANHVASTEQTNPTAGTVLVDTGALDAGKATQWRMLVTICASAAAQFQIQRRNAANGANVTAILIYVPAGDTRQFLFGFTLEASERVRVVMDDNLTGTAAAEINYEQVT